VAPPPCSPPSEALGAEDEPPEPESRPQAVSAATDPATTPAVKNERREIMRVPFKGGEEDRRDRRAATMRGTCGEDRSADGGRLRVRSGWPLGFLGFLWLRPLAQVEDEPGLGLEP